MINLINYIKIFEGGAAGHMAHPYDYAEFTGNDLIEFIDDLFSGKIEHMKEKLDGFNIEATKNNNNEVVFIRNNGDRNSERGGMSIEDIKTKWEGKQQQQKTFLTAATTITKIFEKVDKKFFNPDETHRKIINCECIVEGNTNIVPYASDRVAFHGYKMYEWNGEKWIAKEDVEGNVEELYKAAEGIDQAKPRPDLVINSQETANKLAEKFKKEVTKLWKNEKLELTAAINEWRHKRYAKFAPDWMKEDDDIFNRLFNEDKSVNLGTLKKRYPEHVSELSTIDKDKDFIDKVNDPLSNLFLSIGNEAIDIMDGFVNSGAKDKTIASLKNELSATISLVNKNGNEADKKKLMKALERIKMLGDKLNTAEGIVIVYKGRRMKLTGSFAPLNQALGLRFNYEQNEQ
jgi:hypothetical protein